MTVSHVRTLTHDRSSCEDTHMKVAQVRTHTWSFLMWGHTHDRSSCEDTHMPVSHMRTHTWTSLMWEHSHMTALHVRTHTWPFIMWEHTHDRPSYEHSHMSALMWGHTHDRFSCEDIHMTSLMWEHSHTHDRLSCVSSPYVRTHTLPPLVWKITHMTAPHVRTHTHDRLSSEDNPELPFFPACTEGGCHYFRSGASFLPALLKASSYSLYVRAVTGTGRGKV